MIFCDLCVGEGGARCDFCRYFDFNGKDGVYTGEGKCNKHEEESDPGGVCDDFHCKKEKPC
jgi:hypothetical protein